MKTLSRRRFLVASGGVGAAAIASNWLPRRAYSNPLGKPIGIQLYAVNAGIKENPAGTLKAIKDIGFGEVETAGFGGLSAKEFRKLLELQPDEPSVLNKLASVLVKFKKLGALPFAERAATLAPLPPAW